jgi:hypothetical protein
MASWPPTVCRDQNETAQAGAERTDPGEGVRNAPLRAAVTAHAGLPMAGSALASSRPTPAPAQAATEKSRSPSTYLWAMLLARIYESQAQGWACLARRGCKSSRCAAPRCGEPTRLIAFASPKSPDSHPEPGPGLPKRPLPSPARTTQSRAGPSDATVPVAQPR